MKHIDDSILQVMIDNGEQQKVIARFFGVSEPAISKRLKRLRKQEVHAAVFESLSEKERLFVAARVGGDNQTKAASIAFDCGSADSAKSIGYQLSKDPRIQEAIATVMNEEGLDRRYLVKRLKRHVDNQDPHVSLKSLDMSFRLTESYPATKSINLNATLEGFVPIDLSLYE